VCVPDTGSPPLHANHLEFAPVKFAISRVGATAVPFTYLNRRDAMAYVLAQSACQALIATTGFADQDYLALLDDIEPGWEHAPRRHLPALERVVQIPVGLPAREGVLTLNDVVTAGAGLADWTQPEMDPQQACDILCTSGTTGSPKGVVLTHDGLLRNAFSSALTRAFEDGGRILFSLPLYHVFGNAEGSRRPARRRGRAGLAGSDGDAGVLGQARGDPRVPPRRMAALGRPGAVP
jgi:fatty-acyl-CoA synthase